MCWLDARIFWSRFVPSPEDLSKQEVSDAYGLRDSLLLVGRLIHFISVEWFGNPFGGLWQMRSGFVEEVVF